MTNGYSPNALHTKGYVSFIFILGVYYFQIKGGYMAKQKLAQALEPKQIKKFTIQTLNKIGAWAFIFGIIMAAVAGF